jgi:hypothetical protein
MWQVENHTPFAHHGGFLRDHQARSLWCVWLKASFVFRADQPVLFDAGQTPVHLAPVFDGDALLADSDLTPPKPMVDVVVLAKGYAPQGMDRFSAGISIAGRAKLMDVVPPATWSKRGAMVPGEAVPGGVALTYANAWGGVEFADNPLGQGFVTGEAQGKALPRVVPVGVMPAKPSDKPQAMALSPVPKTWPQRRDLGGTYDDDWSRRRAPLLPADLDPRYWQAVPEDQRIARDVASGAQVILVNLTSSDGAWSDGGLAFALPHLAFEVATKFRNTWVQQQAELQTILLDCETRRLTLCWQATLPIEASQNDVLVDRTFVALRDHSGFRVRPEDASLFASGADAGQPMTEGIT